MTLALLLAWASVANAGPGRTVAPALSLPPDARAIALGEACTAAVDDASALFWNPAALTRIVRHSLVLTHGAHHDSGRTGYIAYAAKPLPGFAFGVSVQHFSAGRITETDVAGAEIGEFSPSDMAVSGGVSATAGWLSAGATYKHIRSRITTSASSNAFDLGLISAPLWGERVRIGAAATNLGGRIRFDGSSENLERRYRIGSAITGRFGSTSLDLVKPSEDTLYSAVGYEKPLSLDDDWKMTPRVGFNTRYLDEVQGLAGLSFGFGLSYRKASLDYALLTVGALGQMHRITLRVAF